MQEQVSQVMQKYHSIHSMDKANKIEAIKDTSLNPFLFDDPYDGLANSLSRWTQEAPKFGSADPAKKMEIASKYYDEAIGPVYQKAGVTPLSKSIWMNQAWDQALKYNVSKAYGNPIMRGIASGVHTATAEMINADRTLGNIIGLPITSYVDSVRHGDYTGMVGWQNLYMNIHNRVKEDGLVTGLAKGLEDTGEINPISKELHNFSGALGFWSGVAPARLMSEKATSMIVENAMLLPIFGAIEKASALGIGLVARAGEGVPYIKNLTQVLGATKSGQTVSKMLQYGTEGMMFGALTTDAEDKKDAWKMGLQFAAMGTLMHVAGSALGGKAAKLVDHLPDGEDKDVMQEAEETANLGLQGRRKATAEEFTGRYRTHVASVLAAGGMGLHRSILEEALAHIALSEKAPMEKLDAMKWRQDLIDEDPDRYKSVFTHMRAIEFWLGARDLKLSSLDDTQWGQLQDWLHSQAKRAGEELDLDVPQVQQLKGMQLLNDHLKTPEGKQELQAEVLKQQQKFIGDPEAQRKTQQAAMSELLRRRVDAVKRGAEERTQTGPENVAAHQPETKPAEPVKPKTVKVESTPDPKTARKKTDSRYTYDNKGNITAYQMSISYDWRVAKENLAKKKGGNNTDKFWKEYVDTLFGDTDDDTGATKAFVEDLEEFNPLKEAGLDFEKSNKGSQQYKMPDGSISREGGDYTNFLAFMYSYKDKLPDPVADKLEDILMNSPKMSALLGRKTTTAAIDEFSQAIHNHIDMFMRSKYYQDYGQRNVFRSTQPGVKGPTSLSPWQSDTNLLDSAYKKDMQKVRAFFPGKSKVNVDAKMRYLATLDLLQRQEKEVYLAGKPYAQAKIMAKARKTLAEIGVK